MRRIKTKADVEALDQKIKQDLGIDVRKYCNEEVVANLVAMLVFPEYIVTWMILPVVASVVLFVLGFFVLQLVHIEYVLYAIFGVILFLGSGLLLGLLLLIARMKKDVWSITNYSLEVMKTAVNDINQVNGQVSKENRSDALKMLFQGITHIVSIPMLTTAIYEKMPVLSFVINPVLRKVLSLIADNMKFDAAKLDASPAAVHNPSTSLQLYTQSISSVSSGLERILGLAFNIAKWPLRLLFGLFCLFLLLFVYLIN